MQSNGNGTNLIQNREWHKYKITLWYFIIYNISPCSKVFRVQRIFFAKSLSYQICKLVWTERVCHYVPDFDQVCSCSILSMYNWDSTQISVRADWWLICLRMLRWMLRMQDSGWRGRGQPRQPRYGLGTDIWHVTMLHGSVTAASPAAHTAPQFWHRYIFSFYLPSPGWKWIVNPRFKNLIIRRLFAIMEV